MEEKKKKAIVFNRWLALAVLVAHLFSLFTTFSIPKLALDKAGPKNAESKRIKLVLRDKNKKQVVNTESADEKLPVKTTKYLGKKTQTFARQSVAKKTASFKAAGKGQKNGVKVVQRPALGANHQKTRDRKSGKKKIRFSDLAFSGNLVKKIEKKISQRTEGIQYGKVGEVGLGQNNDYIEDLPLSDMTKLNTIEFKYYGFYFRIRQKLEQYWGDSLRAQAKKMWHSGKRVPASSNKITSLLVTLDTKGNIVNVHIKATSGITELDNAAIESFNRAGPFPNPPQGMMKNGLATIEWGFVVKG